MPLIGRIVTGTILAPLGLVAAGVQSGANSVESAIKNGVMGHR